MFCRELERRLVVGFWDKTLCDTAERAVAPRAIVVDIGVGDEPVRLDDGAVGLGEVVVMSSVQLYSYSCRLDVID
jgi:hypothetical protein